LYARASDMAGNTTSAAPVRRILDSFNQQDGLLASSWSGRPELKHFRIIGQQVDVRDGGLLYWQPTSFGPGQDAVITLVHIDPENSRESVLLKVHGDDPNVRNGAIEVRYYAKHQLVHVLSRTPDQGWQQVATFPAPFQDGDQLGDQAKTRARLRVPCWADHFVAADTTARRSHASRRCRPVSAPAGADARLSSSTAFAASSQSAC